MFVPYPSNPKQNRLLAALPDSDYGRLLPDLEPITMPLGWDVFNATVPVGYVYFPTTSVVSILHAMENDAPAEITLANKEDLIGMPLFMDTENTLRHCVVHTAGDAFRVKARVLKSEFALGGGFQQLVLRYAKSKHARLAQIAACGQKHVALQQLSRWLLLSRDALSGAEIRMTPELIGNLLRREGMAQAVETLERAGLIHYSRGHVTILDRTQLQHYACDCYAAVKSELATFVRDRNALTKASGQGGRGI